MAGTATTSRKERISEYVKASSKSPVAAVIYSLIYGPFGCIYTDPKSTVIALLAAVALGLVYWPLIAVVWVACVIVAPFQVKKYNARLKREARYTVV
ncbi:MAG: hypothetical protein KDI67_06755 [Gammaproteobacteria bacterium]|nr:hypothetical protein [Gammaproteobacteria bacterium]